VSNVFQALGGVFSGWGMSSGNLPVEMLVESCVQAGAGWLAAQFTDENKPHLSELEQACNGRIPYGIWDATPDAWRTSQLLAYDPQFYIAQSEGYMPDWAGIIEELPPELPCAVVTNFEGLDDAQLIERDFACLPECYRADAPNIDPLAMAVEALSRGYPIASPCLGAYGGYPLAGYPTVAPFCVWVAETMSGNDWTELARRTAMPPPPTNGVPVPEWWEKAYPGGPMVAVRGFPRPLYPPDAASKGKKPSVDGPDVEAYKRTVSRAGRWKWQAFDQAFSNGFSHGKSGNVIDTGIAGIQRQQKVDDTGWVGEKTFNTLRSIRIPEGLPHAGEMAMDARSVELVNAAFDRFKGKEPTSGGNSSAQARLTKAQSQIGVKESPASSNMQKYGEWYRMNGVPWCAIFCAWCDQQGTRPTDSFEQGIRYSYVPYVVSDARLGLNGLAVTSSPKPGDLVCYDWGRDGEYDHVGIVETPPSPNGDFVAVEGNTSTSDNSNGGQVMRRNRNRNAQGTVFVRVAEP
jgi:hypothetical protein